MTQSVFGPHRPSGQAPEQGIFKPADAPRSGVMDARAVLSASLPTDLVKTATPLPTVDVNQGIFKPADAPRSRVIDARAVVTAPLPTGLPATTSSMERAADDADSQSKDCCVMRTVKSVCSAIGGFFSGAYSCICNLCSMLPFVRKAGEEADLVEIQMDSVDDV